MYRFVALTDLKCHVIMKFDLSFQSHKELVKLLLSPTSKGFEKEHELCSACTPRAELLGHAVPYLETK